MKKSKGKTDPAVTVLVITVGFLTVYLIAEWKWALYTSVIIGGAGILSGFLRRKIDYLWMKLAWLLSLIVPNVLLSAVYFLLLTPIALVSRVFRSKDPLSLRNNSASMFRDKEKPYTKESFEKPW